MEQYNLDTKRDLGEVKQIIAAQSEPRDSEVDCVCSKQKTTWKKLVELEMLLKEESPKK